LDSGDQFTNEEVNEYYVDDDDEDKDDEDEKIGEDDNSIELYVNQHQQQEEQTSHIQRTNQRNSHRHGDGEWISDDENS